MWLCTGPQLQSFVWEIRQLEIAVQLPASPVQSSCQSFQWSVTELLSMNNNTGTALPYTHEEEDTQTLAHEFSASLSIPCVPHHPPPLPLISAHLPSVSYPYCCQSPPPTTSTTCPNDLPACRTLPQLPICFYTSMTLRRLHLCCLTWLGDTPLLGHPPSTRLPWQLPPRLWHLDLLWGQV